VHTLRDPDRRRFKGVKTPLSRRSSEGDRKATARFVADYTDPVYAYVRHRLAPRANLVDDIVQDVFGMPRFIDRVNSEG
jgi:hypothetical protein